MAEHPSPNVDPLEAQYAAPANVARGGDAEFQKRTSRSASYWFIEDVADPPPISDAGGCLWGGRTPDGSPMNVAVEAPPFAPLPPPMIDKPELPLVAIIRDDEDVDAEERGGPNFVGAGPVSAPVGPPGLGADHTDVAPATTAPGAFMAAWSMSARTKMQKSQRAQRRRRRALRMLVLLLLGIAAYFAYPFVHTKIVARSVSADLRSYVEGKGVAYAPKGGAYSVRLPKVPTHSNPQLMAPTIPLTIATRASIVTGRDYKMVVLVGDLPGGVLPKGLRHGLQDPKIGGTGTLTDVGQTELAGETAYTGTYVSSEALPRRVAVLVHGDRLYVIRVQAQSVGTVFNTLIKSFRFTRPG